MTMARELTNVEMEIIRAIYREAGPKTMVEFMCKLAGEEIEAAGGIEAVAAEVRGKMKPAAEAKPAAPAEKVNSFGLTPRERAMLVTIATTDYNDDDPSKATWASVVCANRADSALVANLSKKGMVVCQGSGREATIELTTRGLMAYRDAAPESEYAKECARLDAEQAAAERAHPNL
jgi:hypothetical protein